MTTAHMEVFEEELGRLEAALNRLRHDSNAKAVFLIDKNGQQIAAAGDVEDFDSTSLASLTAGNVAATDGLAKLIGEREFSVLFHEGKRDHIHISIVAKRAILRVKRASAEMDRIFDDMTRKSEQGPEGRVEPSPFAEITDEDIDSLFSD
jgi:predicted regulator of Ras-like GTPase activity (Roadblock/LC7/MglB family)